MTKDFNQFMIDKIDALSDKFSGMELRISEKISKVTEDLRVESRSNYVSISDFKNFKTHVYDDVEKEVTAHKLALEGYKKMIWIFIGVAVASTGLGVGSLLNFLKMLGAI